MFMNKYNYASAPIIPFDGIGCFKLYGTLAELDDIRNHLSEDDYLEKDNNNTFKDRCIYETKYLYLTYNTINQKLWKITTKPTFKGKYSDSVYIGADLEKAIQSLDDVRYDDEEVYISEKNGIFFEPDNELAYISIYVKELDSLDDDDFFEGKWWV